MRWTWLVALVAAGGCDPAFRQVGPGDTGFPQTTGGDDDDADTSGETNTGLMLGSCDRIDSAGICEEYIGSGWDTANMEADCGGADTLVDGPCPPSDLGGCNETRQNPLGTLVWYYSGAFYSPSDAGALQSECLSSYYDWTNP